ncbi:DUF5663 domain-containing protein [Nocardioides sp.]|uniref:DUF5663 domain-containing protein n=1 Tax=Nocardioides sp. TaxID=35761 RepID=UPI003D12E2DC
MTISFDAEYFQSVGLTALSPDGKQSLASAVYAETELRVGTALSDGLSDEQLAEFEKIIDQDEATVRKVLDEHDHDNYQNNLDKPLEVLAEVAGSVWLAAHKPTYHDTVRAIHEELRQEVAARRVEILATEGLSPAEVEPDTAQHAL